MSVGVVSQSTREEEAMKLLGRKQKQGPPDKSFTHSDTCAIVKADSTVEIPWSETRSGHWEARCQCGVEYYDEPAAKRVRLDPLDPGTSRHLGQCEFAGVTDPAVLRIALRVRDGAGGDYFWVECAGCETAWQVPHYESYAKGR